MTAASRAARPQPSRWPSRPTTGRGTSWPRGRSARRSRPAAPRACAPRPQGPAGGGPGPSSRPPGPRGFPAAPVAVLDAHGAELPIRRLHDVLGQPRGRTERGEGPDDRPAGRSRRGLDADADVAGLLCYGCLVTHGSASKGTGFEWPRPGRVCARARPPLLLRLLRRPSPLPDEVLQQPRGHLGHRIDPDFPPRDAHAGDAQLLRQLSLREPEALPDPFHLV